MRLILRRGIKDIKKPFSRIPDLEHARHVPAAIAIIGRTPHRTESVVIQHLVPLLTELMCSEDMRHGVDVQEFAHDLGPESISCSSRGEGELVPFRVGIGPDEIGHGSFVGNLAEAIDDFDLVDGMDRWG